MEVLSTRQDNRADATKDFTLAVLRGLAEMASEMAAEMATAQQGMNSVNQKSKTCYLLHSLRFGALILNLNIKSHEALQSIYLRKSTS